MDQEKFNEVLKAFHLNAKCVQIKTHRHFAFYDLELEPGCSIRKISNSAQELALALRMSVPIIRVIPEQGVVRLQTTTSKPEVIEFNTLYNRSVVPNGTLPLLLGETDTGEPLWTDMASNPHMIVAGASGSGKSVFLHNLIANVRRRNDASMYLIDTKRIEFTGYNRLLGSKIEMIGTSYAEASAIAEHLIDKMESRYRLMARLGIHGIESAPTMFKKHLLIIDEAADVFLLDSGKRFENLIIRLAQKARAAGIYIVLATQRPSVNVITGVIKANFLARLACKVSSHHDSSVILDQVGAENLIGRGDALFRSPTSEPVRLQIAFSDPNLCTQ